MIFYILAHTTIHYTAQNLSTEFKLGQCRRHHLLYHIYLHCGDILPRKYKLIILWRLQQNTYPSHTSSAKWIMLLSWIWKKFRLLFQLISMFLWDLFFKLSSWSKYWRILDEPLQTDVLKCWFLLVSTHLDNRRHGYGHPLFQVSSLGFFFFIQGIIYDALCSTQWYHAQALFTFPNLESSVTLR